MSTHLTPFHIAVQVRDIAEARSFYGELLGCAEGRNLLSQLSTRAFGGQQRLGSRNVARNSGRCRKQSRAKRFGERV